VTTRNVAAEILSLCELVNAGQPKRFVPIGPDDIQHFIAGIENEGDITFKVNPDQCGVVVAVEDFQADKSASHLFTGGGSVKTIELAADWMIGGDLFFVFPPGTAKISLQATPLGGMTYFARAVGYLLPHRALSRLSRIGTTILTTT
jgi:hypothetical protein